MSAEDTKAAARRAYEKFNHAVQTGNFAELDEFLAVDMVDHNPLPGQKPGPEGVKEAFAVFRSSFPDLHFTVEDMIAEGDRVATRLIAHGTHKGAFQGVPPTGKQFSQEGIDILRIENGMVVERWGISDDLGLMQQLGMIPGVPG